MSRNGDVEKIFQPSTMGWIGLTRQRMRGTTNKESPEVLAKFKEMAAIRDHLKKIEASMIKWKKAMKSLYNASKNMGDTVETDEKLKKDALWSAEILMKDDTALKNIKEKIKTVNQLLDQKKTLKFIRLKGEYAEHKLEKLRKQEAKESYERQSQKYLSIKKESAKQREYIISQVLMAIDKCVTETNEYGVAHLIKPQLQSFKLAQFHMFLNCQKLIQGRQEDEHLIELEDHWNNFTSRVAEEIPNNAAGGSLDGSMPFLATANEYANRKLSDFTDDGADQGEGAGAKPAPAVDAVKAKIEADHRMAPEVIEHEDEEEDEGDVAKKVEDLKKQKPSVLETTDDEESDFEADDLSSTDNDLKKKQKDTGGVVKKTTNKKKKAEEKPKAAPEVKKEEDSDDDEASENDSDYDDAGNKKRKP